RTAEGNPSENKVSTRAYSKRTRCEPTRPTPRMGYRRALQGGGLTPATPVLFSWSSKGQRSTRHWPWPGSASEYLPPPPPTRPPATRRCKIPASTDEPFIKQLWCKKRFANANVGIHPSGFLVLDIDGPAGEDSRCRLVADGFPPPPTVTAVTGNIE